MRNKEIDDAIESVNTDKKESMRAELHRRIDIQPIEQAQTKTAHNVFNVKTAALGTAGLAVVCLAIVLPVTLRERTPQDITYKYTASDFSYDDLGCTVKEYADSIGKDILYLDRYDTADDCVTVKYFLPENEDKIIYISEDLYDGETGEHVRISAVEANISIDSLEQYEELYKRQYVYKDTNIYWGYDISESGAYFKCDGYKYYVHLYEPSEENSILEIVEQII